MLFARVWSGRVSHPSLPSASSRTSSPHHRVPFCLCRLQCFVRLARSHSTQLPTLHPQRGSRPRLQCRASLLAFVRLLKKPLECLRLLVAENAERTGGADPPGARARPFASQRRRAFSGRRVDGEFGVVVLLHLRPRHLHSAIQAEAGPSSRGEFETRLWRER